MKGDKTTVLALILAVVILAIVGIKSFLDYKVAELEKIHGGGKSNETAEASGTASEDASPVNPNPPSPENALPPSGDIAQVTGAEGATGEFPAGSIDRLPRSVLPPIPAELQSTPGGSSTAENPAPEDQAELEALRRENAMFQEKLNQIRSGGNRPPADGTPPPPATSPENPGGPGSALSAVMEEVGTPGAGPNGLADPGPIPPPVFGPTGESGGGSTTGADAGPGAPPNAPGGPGAPPAPVSAAEKEAEIAALAEQVKRQPALAKVVDFNAEWAVLVISSGAESNISPEMRLAVRRGDQIVGFIKVTEVFPNQSVAELMSRNKFSPTARKPRPGDDVIAFNLF